ncbi:MAG: hypothetical protein QOE83_1125 [Actinomycetota bacterium]|jgi:uncharacterized protein YbjT (DUF2867 family)|nr:hypothetical protein [Actinomycetota bacterium]
MGNEPADGTILVTGASGVIGSRLTTRLASDGYEVITAGRRAEVLKERWPDLRAVELDVLHSATLPPALEGVSTAYYLVHSMESGVDKFEQTDHDGAANFGRAAKESGVRRVIYLGGLGSEDDGPMSPHLASRQEVGRVLAEEGPPVLEFRAAMVIGRESASFRMLRDLVNRLPAMVVPRWVDTKTQPIAIDDVIEYLAAGASIPLESQHTVVEVGGPETVTYREMMKAFASSRGVTRPIVSVPLLTPWLSSLWCGLTTSVPSALARPLIEGLSTEVVVRDRSATELFPEIRPMAFEDALKRANAEE